LYPTEHNGFVSFLTCDERSFPLTNLLQISGVKGQTLNKSLAKRCLWVDGLLFLVKIRFSQIYFSLQIQTEVHINSIR